MRGLPSIIALACAACGPGGDAADAGPGQDCGVALRLEVRVPSGEFLAMDETGEAELVLGFQGFKYVYLRGRAARLPGNRSGTAVSTLDGEAARSQPLGDLGWQDDGAGGLVTDALTVFFNDEPLPSLIDRGCTVELVAGDGTCRARSSGHVVLSYDPNCYEGPDGDRVCPDAGAP